MALPFCTWKMMNSKVYGMLLIASAAVAASVLISAQNVVASMCPPMCEADIDEEEAALAENATSTNQTASGNMTGTNSTS